MEENKLPLGQPEAEDAEPDLITLTDEEGTEYTFEVIDAVDHNGTHYMAMVPYVEDEKQLDDDLQLVIMKVGQDEEGEFLDVVEDDEELYEISGVFEKRLLPAWFDLLQFYILLLINNREPDVLRGIADLPPLAEEGSVKPDAGHPPAIRVGFD